MPKRKEKFHDKAMMTHHKLKLYVEHGDVALEGQDPQEFCKDVLEVLQGYVDLRNMFAFAAELEQDPRSAIQDWIDLG